MPQSDPLPIVTYDQIQRAYAENKLTIDAEVNRQALRAAVPDHQRAMLFNSVEDGIRHLEKDANGPAVMGTARHAMGSVLQSLIAQKAKESGQVEQTADGFAFVKFSNEDLIEWIRTGLVGLFRHKFDWVRASDTPDPLPRTDDGHLRVAVFGDWGTGAYGAPHIAASIENDPDGFDLVLHLGDTYYSGQPEEIKNQLINAFPYRADAVHRSLNGNHEMYSGGQAYLDAIQHPKFDQRASHFFMQNEHWVLVGLDTAYEDHDLTADQVEWLERILAQAGERKVVLFSHHQPFSMLDEQGPKLTARLQSILDAHSVFAWYWGHEHRCVLYDQHPKWGFFGRCSGHGGFPYDRDQMLPKVHDLTWKHMPARDGIPGALILDGPNEYVTANPENYGPHGYMSLAFDGVHMREFVHQTNGVTIQTKLLTAQERHA